MTIPLIAAFTQTLMMLLLGFVALFLILLVLVQRGRGGGLAGALGGMGGSSAFGAKAGDVFTKVTVVAATLWIVLCIVASKITPEDESLLDTNVTSSSSSATQGGSALQAVPGTEESDETSDGAAEETAPAGEATSESSQAEGDTSETEGTEAGE